MITIEKALAYGKARLQHLPSPLFEAQLLLAHVLQRTHSQIIAYPETDIQEQAYQDYLNLIHKRMTGVPAAYLLGYKMFYDLVFKVSEATLIPRDDTETLIDLALARISDQETPTIIDLGTGSGAIALTIKKHRPNACVLATDQSLDALNIAKENAENLGLDIDLIHSNWFSALNQCMFDFILSNPPYIDKQDPHLTGDGVRFEPQSALVADQNGYQDLFILITEARKHLNKNGWIILEHGNHQAECLREKLVLCQYQNISTHQDLSKNDRITLAQWPG